jgi:hypothetical protein
MTVLAGLAAASSAAAEEALPPTPSSALAPSSMVSSLEPRTVSVGYG